MSGWTDARNGIKAVGKSFFGWASSTWDSMSPEAQAFARGLVIGFALGALAVGMLVR